MKIQYNDNENNTCRHVAKENLADSVPNNNERSYAIKKIMLLNIKQTRAN
jgi:hypothetical protein